MELSLTELCTQLQSKQLSPVDAVEAALARIERLNPVVVRHGSYRQNEIDPWIYASGQILPIRLAPTPMEGPRRPRQPWPLSAPPAAISVAYASMTYWSSPVD